MDRERIKVLKKIIRLETYLGGIRNAEVEVISEKENLILIKTWDSYKALEYLQDKRYWEVKDWFKEIPEEWKNV